jgi:hypothetical protein
VDRLLFNDGRLSDYLDERRRQMSEAVQAWDGDAFLQLSSADIREYLIAHFLVSCIELHRNRLQVLPAEDAKWT